MNLLTNQAGGVMTAVRVVRVRVSILGWGVLGLGLLGLDRELYALGLGLFSNGSVEGE